MKLSELLKKKTQPKTCKDCGHNSITGTKRYDFFVLVCVCPTTNYPISVSKYLESLDYTIPKWCPKKW